MTNTLPFPDRRRTASWMAGTFTMATDDIGTQIVLERRGKAGAHGDAWREVQSTEVRDRVIAGLSAEVLR